MYSYLTLLAARQQYGTIEAMVVDGLIDPDNLMQVQTSHPALRRWLDARALQRARLGLR